MNQIDKHYNDPAMRYADYQLSCRKALEEHRLTFREVGKGGVIGGLPRPYRINRQPTGIANKRKVRDATPRSLRKLHWLLDVSPIKLDTMITLTFRSKHPDAKQCLRDWVQMTPLGRRYGADVPYVWVMEYQGRGVVHYHVATVAADVQSYWHSPAALINRSHRNKDGNLVTREVYQGGWADRLAQMWINSVQDMSKEFRDFQMGGIVERLRSPDRAGHYLASYLGKESQKRLPDGECPQGRWWYCHPAIYPTMGESRELVYHADDKRIHKLVHDHNYSGIVVGKIMAPDKPRVSEAWVLEPYADPCDFEDEIAETGSQVEEVQTIINFPRYLTLPSNIGEYVI